MVDGELNQMLAINLPREQWTQTVSALSIAAGECARNGDLTRMFAYTNLCQAVGARLGLVAVQAVPAIAEPPPLARAAGAH